MIKKIPSSSFFILKQKNRGVNMLPKLYTHNIKTIELTKLLERSVCDNLTVTNNLGHVYEPGQSYSK